LLKLEGDGRITLRHVKEIGIEVGKWKILAEDISTARRWY
jgi:hypothetical protein